MTLQKGALLCTGMEAAHTERSSKHREKMLAAFGEELAAHVEKKLEPDDLTPFSARLTLLSGRVISEIWDEDEKSNTFETLLRVVHNFGDHEVDLVRRYVERSLAISVGSWETIDHAIAEGKIPDETL